MNDELNRDKPKKLPLATKITIIIGISYVFLIIFYIFFIYLEHKETKGILIYHICFLGIIIVMWLLIDQYIYKILTKPLSILTRHIANYKYASDEDKLIILNELKALKIENSCELKLINYMLIDLLKNNFYYIENLKQLQFDMNNIKERAYKDGLTGVGSKMSYIIEIDSLKKKILREKIKVAIIMVDVNNLKYVNDRCGHDKGNLYLIGCCKILTETFKHSLIYRVGGDEFIIIVKGKDYEYLPTLYNECTDTYEKTFKQDKVPWEKYSASLGIAILNQELPTIEAVEKAADESMYANKMEFRKQYGSYR